MSTSAHPAADPAAPGPTTGARALVVDDEPLLAGTVATYLERAGYEVRQEGDGPAAVEAVREWAPDVVVLDLGLPGFDGVEVCRRLRTFTDAYVLMLTARDDEVDVLIGLSVGADDYMTKPFRPRELVARVQTLMRRPRTAAVTQPERVEAPQRRFGDLVIDPAARTVHLRDDEIGLTRTEFDVLAALSARPRLAFSRRALVQAVWGEGWVGDEHLVDVHVAHVRRKLDDDPVRPRFIHTVRGVGYRMGTGR